MDEIGLGQKLQLARKAAGLTQQQLCQQAGLSYSTLAKIERGAIKAPSIFTIQSIAHVLKISLSELIGDDSQTVPISGQNFKQSKSGIRFVYFDINGCLVRFFHRAFSRLAADSGASPDMVETTFWHYNDAVCKGEIDLEQFNRVFAEKLGLNKLDWQDYYLEAVDAVDEMDELLKWSTEHYKIGLLSNIMPGFIDAMLAREILPNVKYSAIIDSSVIGSIKPEAEIYQKAMSAAEVEASQILLVDDSRANLMAAEKFGWHVLWFDDYRPNESIERIRQALEY